MEGSLQQGLAGTRSLGKAAGASGLEGFLQEALQGRAASILPMVTVAC